MHEPGSWVPGPPPNETGMYIVCEATRFGTTTYRLVTFEQDDLFKIYQSNRYVLSPNIKYHMPVHTLCL